MSLSLTSFAIVVWNFFAIDASVSPFLTVYFLVASAFGLSCVAVVFFFLSCVAGFGAVAGAGVAAAGAGLAAAAGAGAAGVAAAAGAAGSAAACACSPPPPPVVDGSSVRIGPVAP